MTSEILAEAERKMLRAVEAMERDFQGLRTGRASTALVERLHVDYYGTQTPLNQLASISVPEPHQIVIQPWDRGVLGAIEKAIHEVRHRPHAERRRDRRPPQHPAAHRGASQGHRPKSVHKRMEEARVEIRNVRREANDGIKKEERDGEVGTDEAHRQLDQLQKLTDRFVARRRPPRRRQGAGGHGGLVAQAPLDRPLARPTDAPPLAHGEASRPGARAAAPSAEAPLLPAEELPRHVAIIMDGNRRWARQPRAPGLRGPRGRRRGRPRPPPARGPARRPDAHHLRVQPRELGPLRRRGRRAVRPPRPRDRQRDRRARRAGRPRPAAGPPRGAARTTTRDAIEGALARTAEGTRLQLNVAWNYAGRTELVDAFRRIARRGRRRPSEIDERTISEALYTGGLPDPDLVIRTGGEQRISNFLDLAVGLRGARVRRLPVARLRPRDVRRRAARVRPAQPPLRPLGCTVLRTRAPVRARARPGPARRPVARHRRRSPWSWSSSRRSAPDRGVPAPAAARATRRCRCSGPRSPSRSCSRRSRRPVGDKGLLLVAIGRRAGRRRRVLAPGPARRASWPGSRRCSGRSTSG